MPEKQDPLMLLGLIRDIFYLFRGHDFRPDYGKLGTLSSVFPSAKIVAMTATATREYQKAITESHC